MRSVPLAAFVVSSLLGLGCAVTDYAVITDNDQTRARGSGEGAIVDTQGKAKIWPKKQITVIWPDGTDEFLHFVDQKADGTSTITTYNNFSTRSEPEFHANQYCNTDWSGCAIFTAPDDNDENIFDGRLNANCAGARSLSLMLNTGRYYGECGRQQARLRVEQKLALLGAAMEARAFGRFGLLWKLDGSNAGIRALNLETGALVTLPDHGAVVECFVPNGGRSPQAAIWLDHAMLGPALRDVADRLDGELRADGLEVTVTYNGVASSFHIAGGAHPDVNARVWRSRANRSF